MTVHVKMLGDFGNNTDRNYCLRSEDIITIKTIINELKLDLTEDSLILVNGSGCDCRDKALKDGDTVAFLPFIDGG